MGRRTGLNATARDVMHLDIAFPPDVEPIASTGLAISPDGQTVAMAGAIGGVSRLYVRRLDRAEASAVPVRAVVNWTEELKRVLASGGVR